MNDERLNKVEHYGLQKYYHTFRISEHLFHAAMC